MARGLDGLLTGALDTRGLRFQKTVREFLKHVGILNGGDQGSPEVPDSMGVLR